MFCVVLYIVVNIVFPVAMLFPVVLCYNGKSSSIYSFFLSLYLQLWLQQMGRTRGSDRKESRAIKQRVESDFENN